MKAKLNFKGEKIEIPDIENCPGIKKYIGLIFNRKGNALLFDFKEETEKAIHSFFCPDFLAVWLNKENKIVEYKLVTPNRLLIKPKSKFTKLIEIPVNKKYHNIIKLFLEDRKKSLNTIPS